MSNGSLKIKASIIVADAIPKVGTLFGLWAFLDYNSGGKYFIDADCVCYSLHGQSLTKIDDKHFSVSAFTVLSPYAMNEFCASHVKQTLCDFAYNSYNEKHFTQLKFNATIDAERFLASLVHTGIGAAELAKLRLKPYLGQSAPEFVPRISLTTLTPN